MSQLQGQFKAILQSIGMVQDFLVDDFFLSGRLAITSKGTKPVFELVMQPKKVITNLCF